MQKMVDEDGFMGSRSAIVREKPAAVSYEQQQQQWAVLKCPRCESSNTKFCYYNNYSLSQPRHFCKACKRYWTRGGTLRNVPVGGGCRRKNKRVKKPPSCSARSIIDGAPSSAPSTVSFASNTHTPAQPDQIIDMSSTLNHTNIPSFYGLPSNPYNIELPPTFSSRSVSNVDTLFRFDHLNDSGALPYHSGFDSTKQTFPDVVSNPNPVLSCYNTIFGQSTCSAVTPLLLHPQKVINGLQQPGQVFCHFGNQLQTHQQGNGEDNQKRLQDWNNNSMSDPLVYWNSDTVCSDPADVGFSVSSLM